jgi:lipopolysaccharide export system protein LptA
MHLARLLSGGNGLRLSAAIVLFFAFIPFLPAQQIPVSMGTKSAGKEVSVTADSQQKDQDIYHLRGHVHIVYEDMRVTADEASFDSTSEDVILPPRRSTTTS